MRSVRVIVATQVSASNKYIGHGSLAGQSVELPLNGIASGMLVQLVHLDIVSVQVW
jgi:hypothetical protein